MQAGSPRSPRAPSCGPAALRQARELEIKVILLLNHSKMQFLLLASHAEARQRRKTANKLFFALFFCAMSSPFCLRKNSLLFPNPQPIARPLPTAGPKLNKSVVCMRKLLGWAGHVTEWGAQKHAWKPLWGCSPQLLHFAQALSLILKAKGFLGSAVLICFCYLLFYSLYSTPWSVSICQPWRQPALSHPTVPSAAQLAVPCCHGKLQVNVEMLRGKERGDQREIKIKKAQLFHLMKKNF